MTPEHDALIRKMADAIREATGAAVWTIGTGSLIIGIAIFADALSKPLGETLCGLISFVGAQLMVFAGVDSRFRLDRFVFFGGASLLGLLGVWIICHAAPSALGL